MRNALSRLSSLFDITDEQAMWRVQHEDDHGAFTTLVERWEPKILDLCYRIVGNPHTAQDLTQEAFARVFARRMDYDPSRRFSTYLWRIALNLCYDELRRLRRRGESMLDGEEFECIDPNTPDAHLSDSEEGEIVRSALMKLPELYRTVLVMRHYQNLKFREIADVLEVPEGTVNSRMAEALVQLTRLLETKLPERKPNNSQQKPLPNRKELLVV